MISDKTQNLFKFIDFLYSNIDNFKQYDEVIKLLFDLDEQRNKLSPEKNYVDKLKYDEVKHEIKEKYNIIDKNIIQVIEDKATELNICDPKETKTLWNWNISEIINLKNNFSEDDVPNIIKYKIKYIVFREKTNCTYFRDFLFSDLDEILKELFGFFKDTKENEFEPFEAKTIQVNNISEAFHLFNTANNKQTKINIIQPTATSEDKKRLHNSLADFNFFQVYFDTEKGKVKNNDSILTSENWEQLKYIFFTQRMQKYKENYTLEEKIKLELGVLENLTINKTDYKILTKRYKDYLNQQIKTSEPDEGYKETNWFKIGLKFANGEMNNLLKSYNSNATKIAKHLGNEMGFRPYITESIGTKSKSSNISVYSDKNKMIKIIEHCKANNINVIPYFFDCLPTE